MFLGIFSGFIYVIGWINGSSQIRLVFGIAGGFFWLFALIALRHIRQLSMKLTKKPSDKYWDKKDDDR